jgi:hypothetical protein
MLYMNRSGWAAVPPLVMASHGHASISGCHRSVSSGGSGWTVHVLFIPATPPLRWTIIFMSLRFS